MPDIPALNVGKNRWAQAYLTRKNPLSKYKPSGNILPQYCGNIAAILQQQFLAILLQCCCNTGFRMQISFWQYCSKMFWQYCGSIAARLQQIQDFACKLVSGNIAAILAILPETVCKCICMH